MVDIRDNPTAYAQVAARTAEHLPVSSLGGTRQSAGWWCG